MVSFLKVMHVMFQNALACEWEKSSSIMVAMEEFQSSLTALETVGSALQTNLTKLQKKWMKWGNMEGFLKQSDRLYKIQMQCRQRAYVLMKILAVPEAILGKGLDAPMALSVKSPTPSPDEPIESEYIREQRRLQQLAAKHDIARVRSLDGAHFA